MHLVRLSATQGVNLDHVVEWTDNTEPTIPWLRVVLTPTSWHDMGHPTPHILALTGEERLTMLKWLEAFSRPSAHLAHT
jgi:hypothetical protein